jgi:hypothetical protein
MPTLCITSGRGQVPIAIRDHHRKRYLNITNPIRFLRTQKDAREQDLIDFGLVVGFLAVAAQATWKIGVMLLKVGGALRAGR